MSLNIRVVPNIRLVPRQSIWCPTEWMRVKCWNGILCAPFECVLTNSSNWCNNQLSVSWNKRKCEAHLVCAESTTAVDWNEKFITNDKQRDVFQNKPSNGMSQPIKAANLPFKCVWNACWKLFREREREKETPLSINALWTEAWFERNYNWIWCLY